MNHYRHGRRRQKYADDDRAMTGVIAVRILE